MGWVFRSCDHTACFWLLLLITELGHVFTINVFLLSRQWYHYFSKLYVFIVIGVITVVNYYGGKIKTKFEIEFLISRHQVSLLYGRKSFTAISK